MRGTSAFSVVAVVEVFLGFGLILSKYSFFPVIGFLLVLLGFFAPFYRDSFLRIVRVRKAYADEAVRPVQMHKYEKSFVKHSHSGFPIYMFVFVIVGFVLILSKYSFFPVIGYVIAILGFFSPVYKDWVGTFFYRLKAEPPDLLNTESQPSNISVESASTTKPLNVAAGRVLGPSTSVDQVDIRGIDFSQKDLRGVDLAGRNLRYVNFNYRDLTGADFSGSILHGAKFVGAYCINVDFSDAVLNGADLSRSVFSGANLTRANLTGCLVYGISALDVQITETVQSDLVVTPYGQPKVIMDDLRIAEFVSFLLTHRDVCDTINTVSARVVLILGRFNSKRSALLNNLRVELRKQGYLPMVFDFDSFSGQSIVSEITALARISRFMIADIGNSDTIPETLEQVIPSLSRIVPIQPLSQFSSGKTAALEQLEDMYPSFLHVYRYKDVTDLLNSLQSHVIKPLEDYIHNQMRDGDNLAMMS